MRRRTGWIIAGAAIVVVAAVALWVVLSAASAPSSTPRPSPSASQTFDVQSRAQAALDDHLDECVATGAPGGVVPEGCGIRIPWGTEFASVADVRFRVDRMPEITLGDDDLFTADGGVLVATVTGTGQDGAPRTETYRTETWGVRGEVTPSDDGVALVVW
ncbi:hypothetical protein [Microbacterium sp. NPDC089695]|uniref:hypothetical protein n=1 Tax=Microbacterium sp. NPDC089695 TaxID=3364198 RepID=UPI0037FDFC2B